MANFVLKDASIVIGGVDLSNHCKSVSISYDAESQDNTVMGDTTRSMIGGLLNYGIEAEFTQDYASGSVDATLFPLVGTTAVVVIKATSGAVSATNPKFTATALITAFSPVTGSVGDLAVSSCTMVPGGSTLARATS